MKTRILTICAAVLILAAGCTGSGDRTVVARVNQTRITVGDFKKQLENLDNFQVEQATATDPKARKEFLEDLIGIELVVQEAKRQGLDRDADYKKSMESMKKDYEEAKKRIERRYQESARNELFRALLKKELADKAGKLQPPTDKEVKDFYQKNIDKMVAMNGKRVPLKDVESQIKDRLMQERQRDLYLDYLKGLREKAKVTIDDKGMQVLAASLTAPTVSFQPARPATPPATGEQKADDTKK
jgi:peptidyl-prolyl cis-trans isomerase C